MAVRMRTYYDKAYKGKKKDFLNLLKERIEKDVCGHRKS